MSVRIPDLPILSAPTDDTLIVADHVGTGVIAASALRDYVLTGSTISGLSVANLTVTAGANLTGPVNVAGAFGVNGAAGITGDLNVNGDIAATGIVRGDGGLFASSDATFGLDIATDGNRYLSWAGDNYSMGLDPDTGTVGWFATTGPIMSLSAGGNLDAKGTVNGEAGIFAGTDTQFGMLLSGATRVIQYATGFSDEFVPSTGIRSWNGGGVALMALNTGGNLRMRGGALGGVSTLTDDFLALNGASAFSDTGWRSSLIINGGGRPTGYGFEFFIGGVLAYMFKGDNAYKAGGGPWADISDARIKQDVVDYTHGLAEIMQLRPVQYRYVPATGRDDRLHHGLIAQEVEVVMPEMVSQGPGDAGNVHYDDMRTLDTQALIFALCNAVRTLADRITALEAAPLRTQAPTPTPTPPAHE